MIILLPSKGEEQVAVIQERTVSSHLAIPFR